MLRPMQVSSLTVDPFTNMPIVILKDAEGRMSVPIWIGLVEASAIATELEHIRLDRPMTHDLMTSILGQCRARVARVEIYDLRNNTFYATLHLEREGGGPVALDARPSDAIALALRTGAQILVSQKVIDKARRMDLLEPELPPPNQAELLEGLNDSAFGKWKM